MVRLNLDLRFAYIATEGFIARRHAEIALRRLDHTAEEVRGLVLAELQDSPFAQDEVERDIAFQEIYLLEEELPRLELYGTFFVLFAVFESVVKRLPRYVVKNAAPPALTRDFIANATRYYRDLLKVPLFATATEEEFFRMLSDVRTAIAHATGNISLLNANVRRRFDEQWFRKYEGLAIRDAHLAISPDLILRSAKAVEEALRSLISRLQQAYPPRRRRR